MVKVGEVKPYIRNPRKNDAAVDAVAESIKQCGYRNLIIVDEDMVIIAGHTRLKALQKLGYSEFLVQIEDDMSEEMKRKYRLLDNKTAELSEWDFGILPDELEGLDFGDFDFGFLQDEPEEKETPYSAKVNIPQYEITGERPTLAQLVNDEKTEQLLEEIEAANVTEEEKEFLRKGAYRHLVFNYKNIAEYYANASPEMQELMEKSALVIIDIADAIRHGYCEMMEFLADLNDSEEDGDDDD